MLDEDKGKYSKYRIIKRDPLNWVIEGYQEGGREISRGRYAGQPTKAKWDDTNPVGYFPLLKHAAHRLLDVVLGDEWPEDGWTGADLTAALDAAYQKVAKCVKETEGDDDSE